MCIFLPLVLFQSIIFNLSFLIFLFQSLVSNAFVSIGAKCHTNLCPHADLFFTKLTWAASALPSGIPTSPSLTISFQSWSNPGPLTKAGLRLVFNHFGSRWLWVRKTNSPKDIARRVVLISYGTNHLAARSTDHFWLFPLELTKTGVRDFVSPNVVVQLYIQLYSSYLCKHS